MRMRPRPPLAVAGGRMRASVIGRLGDFVLFASGDQIRSPMSMRVEPLSSREPAAARDPTAKLPAAPSVSLSACPSVERTAHNGRSLGSEQLHKIARQKRGNKTNRDGNNDDHSTALRGGPSVSQADAMSTRAF